MNNQTHLHNLDAWAEAHVFYDFYEHDVTKGYFKIAKEEYQWKKEILEKAPHGELMVRNSFFKQMKTNRNFYLVHVTPNIHNVLNDGILYSSSGCLVGSVYCVPATKEDGKLRMHNLGDFIFNREMPLFSKFIEPRPTNPLSIIVLELNFPENYVPHLIGTDYLQLGEVHYNTFKELEYLLSKDENRKLKESCVYRVKKSLHYLFNCNRAFYSKDKYELTRFMNMFISNIENIPLLGYFYFETLSEYIMLYQDNDEATIYHELGEFYTTTHKELVFYLCPHLSKHFSLSQFKPSFNEVVSYMKERKVFKKLDEEHLLSYLVRRLIFLTNARFYNNQGSRLIDWRKVEWDFDELATFISPLLGHLIHRELRTFGRYPHFYFYFDQTKALQIWNYWNHMNIIIPFNGIIPKGEIGINPAYPDLDYKVYTAKSYTKKGKTYLDLGKQENIRVIPKLVDPKFTFMGENKKEEIK